MRFALVAGDRPPGASPGRDRLLAELVGRSRHDWALVDGPARAAAEGACAVLATGPAAGSSSLPTVVLADALPARRRAWVPGRRRADVPRCAAAHVLATSPAVHDALAPDLPAGRCELLRPGLDPLPPPVPPAWPRGGLLLAAGPVGPRARLEVAVEAYRQALAAGYQGRLVVAGPVEPGAGGLVARLREQAAGLDVTVLPDPGTAVLHALLGTATALLAPALEDAGALTREALALGTPVLAAAAGPDRTTVLHDRTGWLLAPDARALAHQALMVGVCTPDDLAPVRAACTAQAASFTWDAVVRRLDDVLELVGLGLPVGPAVPAGEPARGLSPRRGPAPAR